MKLVCVTLVILLALFGGLVLGVSQHDYPDSSLPADKMVLPIEELAQNIDLLYEISTHLFASSNFFRSTLDRQQIQLEEQQRLIGQLIAESIAQQELSKEIFEQQLLARLGTPIDRYISDNLEILLFNINENSYRSYLAKIKLLEPSALKVRLAHNEYGRIETTSAAVAAENAIFGVNGGGFWYAPAQDIYLPVGNTVINGELIGSFIGSIDDVFFCGLTAKGELVGGRVWTRDQLLALNALYGVSFTPQLIKGRFPQTIPDRWKGTRHPRTIIGNFANGDIFFWVIDGRQPGWSRGATLEDVQIKLLRLGAIDAYNLDGGGSSTMVFKGKVINRPSDGRERAVVTNFVAMP